MRPIVLITLLSACATWLQAARIIVVPVPNRGLTPDAEIEPAGVIHLAYTLSNDVFYVRSPDDGASFSAPLRVNSEPNSSHSGMFRGPDLVLGKEGRPHVIWYSNGYQRKLPKDQWGVLFSYLNDGGTAFVPVRNLNRKPSDNYSVAANDEGRVAVFWMADGLFLQESKDNGVTFGEPRKIALADTCECCASRARFLPDGTLLCAYRDKQNNARDMFLLAQRRSSDEFTREKLSVTPWQVNACPMTGTFISSSKGGAVAAWETKGQVYFARCDSAGRKTAAPEVALGTRGKFPIALAAPDGTLLVSWKRVNAVEWQFFDSADRPIGAVQSAPGSNPHRHAAVVTKNGEFRIFN
jgi:hypothetical protein